jgi:hypothetical protein
MQKLILSFFLTSAVILFSGCGANDSGKTALGKSETNILGVYKSEKAGYSHTGMNTFGMKSDEIAARSNYSGNKTTLLWGLVTLQDH